MKMHITPPCIHRTLFLFKNSFPKMISSLFYLILVKCIGKFYLKKHIINLMSSFSSSISGSCVCRARASHVASRVPRTCTGRAAVPWIGSTLYFNHYSSEAEPLTKTHSSSTSWFRKPMTRAELVSISSSEDEGNLRFVYELLSWVEEMQVGIHSKYLCSTLVPWTQQLSKSVGLLCVPCIDYLNYRCLALSPLLY